MGTMRGGEREKEKQVGTIVSKNGMSAERPPPNYGRQNTACNVPSNYTKGIKAGDLRPLSSIIQPAPSHMTQRTGTLVPPAPLDDSMSRADMVMIPCLTSLMMFMNFVSLIS